MLGRFPLLNPRSGVWLAGPPAAVDLDVGVPTDLEPVVGGPGPRGLRRVTLTPAPAPVKRGDKVAAGITLAPGVENRLDDYGGHLYVQILDANDPAAAARALERARSDLRSLETLPAWQGAGCPGRSQVGHRIRAEDHGMNDLSNKKLVRALLAVATSIATGATAGRALAHKPLAVPVDRPRRQYVTRR